ncbi:MAG: DUF47 domain-containing protein [Haloferacaceae archaeon]
MATEASGTEFVALSETYTDRVVDCVGAFHALVERYADGRPHDDPLRRVREFETICDVTNRELSRTLAGFRDGGSTPFVREGVRIDDLIGLYQALDGVANGAERVAEELDAVDPALPADRAAGLRTMASLAVDAVALLADVVDDYVRALCDPASSARIRRPVERIRGLESQCDELRNRIVARAFADGGDATALTCYLLATNADAVVDAAEDVTDRLVYASGGRSWVDLPSGPADG